MCGFVGAFDLNSGSQPIAEGLREQLRSQVLEMSKKIRRRGPDWSGIYTGNNAILVDDPPKIDGRFFIVTLPHHRAAAPFVAVLLFARYGKD